MEIIFWILFALFVISTFFLVVCFNGGDSKLYLRLFERKLWKGWESVVENFDTAEYLEHYVSRTMPSVNNYKFIVMVDGQKRVLHYWESTGSLSVHERYDDESQFCLCGFDKYHQKVVKSLLCEKFDFMKEVIEKE